MPKVIDLTGQRFGKLTVLHRAESRKYRSGATLTAWICKCDCGNKIEVLGTSLRTGNTKSCGCIRNPSLVGMRFGNLVVEMQVEDYISTKGHNCTQWLCRCDCGNEKKVITTHLMSGRTKHCGCQTGSKISEALILNLIGKRFGKLTVIKRMGYKQYTDKRRILWLCQCDCGNVTEADTQQLRSGKKKSCGCLNRSDIIGKRIGALTVIEYCGIGETGETLWRCKCDCGNERICQRQYLKKSNNPSCGCINPLEKHGMSHSKIYHIWNSMKCRCFNPKDRNYLDYGGRGITVCYEWSNLDNGFENFFHWAYSNGYNENAQKYECTIDRIDVNGNYEPSNCRWVTQKIQANNKRKTIRIEYKGNTLTAKEWSEKLGINYNTIRYRIKRGYGAEEILSKESLTSMKK